jgi:hypothetical protein
MLISEFWSKLDWPERRPRARLSCGACSQFARGEGLGKSRPRSRLTPSASHPPPDDAHRRRVPGSRLAAAMLAENVPRGARGGLPAAGRSLAAAHPDVILLTHAMARGARRVAADGPRVQGCMWTRTEEYGDRRSTATYRHVSWRTPGGHNFARSRLARRASTMIVPVDTGPSSPTTSPIRRNCRWCSRPTTSITTLDHRAAGAATRTGGAGRRVAVGVGAVGLAVPEEIDICQTARHSG